MITATTSTHRLPIAEHDPVELTVTSRGEGRPYLILHGGAGPQSVSGFADLLAAGMAASVITPTHPGFGGTRRPEDLTTVGQLAALYVALLDELDLTGVTVVGNSIGGWITAEMALLASARITGIVLLDATGIDVPDHAVADVAGLGLDEILNLTFHDPEPFRIDPSTLPPPARAVAAGNQAALAVYSGGSASDPGLRGRLSTLDLPTLVVWGESDQIADRSYGWAYATSVPGARFKLLNRTGHAPQVETPQQVLDAMSDFAAAARPAGGQAFVWSSEYVVEPGVSPTSVWAALVDHHTGTKLSERSDTVEIQGPFAVGTDISVTPHGADFAVRSMITELVEPERYAYRADFNGALLTSRYSLLPLPDGGTRISHYQEIAGPTAASVGPELGQRITEDTPDMMDDLIAAAKARTGAGDA